MQINHPVTIYCQHINSRMAAALLTYVLVCPGPDATFLLLGSFFSTVCLCLTAQLASIHFQLSLLMPLCVCAVGKQAKRLLLLLSLRLHSLFCFNDFSGFASVASLFATSFFSVGFSSLPLLAPPQTHAFRSNCCGYRTTDG